jgi:hypothetical protein
MGTNLAAYSVWVIDDSIPVNAVNKDYPYRDQLLSGNRPFDHGLLWALIREVKDDWNDVELKHLCEELVTCGCSLLAFRHPDHALRYLERTGESPDVIVFDLEYTSFALSEESVESLLDAILSRCFSVVQVYTAADASLAKTKLQKPFLKTPSGRLREPKSKGDCNATDLAQALESILTHSFSTQTATLIRRSARDAIESVLVKIDSLPSDVLVTELLAKERGLPTDQFVDLLSIKISEALETEPRIASVIEDYLTKNNVASSEVSHATRGIVDLITAQVREHVRDNGLFNRIQSLVEQTSANTSYSSSDIAKVVRDFYAFRLYSHPKDDLVRTGDIAAQFDNAEVGGYIVILTPQCDLEKFWKKTRGTLTLIKLHPWKSDEGIKKAKQYGNKDMRQIGNSITAREPMILPSIPVSTIESSDYALFVHEIEHAVLRNQELEDVGKNNQQVQKPLTYSHIETSNNLKLVRVCRISEPFLSGILNGMKASLFQLGIPDYPNNEKTRLEEMLK